MAYYRSVGELPHKRHTTMRRSDGGLHYEELMGREGFSAESALLYHLHSPSDLLAVDTWELNGTHRPNHPLLPRLLQTHQLPTGGDAVNGRRLLAVNADVRVSSAACDAPSPLYRNAIGDELVYVESGTARVETVFGVLDVGPGDFVLLPTSCTHRWLPGGGDPLRLLIIESSGHIRAPKRYQSTSGQFLEQSPYCERDLRGPAEPLLVDDEEAEVYVRHHTGGTHYTYAHHPFDVVGWDGCLYPYAFNVADFEPISGRIHQPPPVFQVFEGPNMVVCAFVPHKTEYHPDAIPVPYNHANVDTDELMFYAQGVNRGADTPIAAGDITWHPPGFIHGPHPGALELSVEFLRTGEWHIKDVHAVMVDTFRPLEVGEGAAACENGDYYLSWRGA
jgi:homogentisate 1,2-dioxygenase